MSSIVGLGQLEAVPLRDAWPDEVANFTPWLAEETNLNQLGETLGLKLQAESIEKSVGPFAADILAKDLVTNRWVLIENQIAPTDHRHLGQLLTYAAGLDARNIIWIAENFREEHRAAIEFLNRATFEEFAFFAVQIELYKIGSSAPAPRFTVVASPNREYKKAQTAKKITEGESTGTQKQYFEYWSDLISSAAGRYQALAARSPYKGNWQIFETLRGGDPRFILNAVLPSDKSLRIETYIDGSLAKLAYSALLSKREAIELAFGQPLSWEELPQSKASRIAFYMPGNERRENRERWAAQHEWLLTWGPKLANAVRPFVMGLDVKALKDAVEG